MAWFAGELYLNGTSLIGGQLWLNSTQSTILAGGSTTFQDAKVNVQSNTVLRFEIGVPIVIDRTTINMYQIQTELTQATISSSTVTGDLISLLASSMHLTV